MTTFLTGKTLGAALLASLMFVIGGCATSSHPPAPVSASTQDYSYVIGPGDSLFGSFVGLFVARIGDADKKLTFRTQAFLPPNPPPPPPP